MSDPDRAWGSIEEIKLADGTPNGAAQSEGVIIRLSSALQARCRN